MKTLKVVDGIMRSDWFYLKDGHWTGSFGWEEVKGASLNELEQDNEIIRALNAQIHIELDIWIKCDERKLCVYSWWLLMNNSVTFGYLIIEWIEKSRKGRVNWKLWKNGKLQARESNPIIILFVKATQGNFPILWKRVIKTWMIWSKVLTRAAQWITASKVWITQWLKSVA